MKCSMQYYTSKLRSSTSFEIDEDTRLWGKLVPNVQQLDPSFLIWKFWIVTDLSHADNQSRAASLTSKWQSSKMVAQTAASYLRIQEIATRTIFTIASLNRDALENLAALIANLYDEVIYVGADKFLENEAFRIRGAKMFELNTGDEISRTFPEPVSLGDLKSFNPDPPIFDWPPMSLSTIPNLESFPKVQELHLALSSHQACFFVAEEEQFSSREELAHMNGIFELTDKVFSGE